VTTPLRVALFVEGSTDRGVRQSSSWLERVWNQHLIELVQGAEFSDIIPISKKDIVAMSDPKHRPTGSEPLDMKLVRLGAGTSFDAAVVAWDLHPKWNETDDFCRWDETVRLLDCLGRSDKLPDAWRGACSARADDYLSRSQPGDRAHAPAFEPGAVLPLCMDPEFESLLTADEGATMRALGMSTRPSGWPRGWGVGGTRRPGDEVIRRAVDCLPRNSEVRRRVRGKWRQNKAAWGEYIVRQLLSDVAGRSAVKEHPLTRRLAELVG
jgi:hypothetical protein